MLKLRLKKVAVTGAIAAGKTTVCQIFQALGAYVVSADKIVHQLLIPSTELGKEIISLFGDGIIRGSELDREEIAKMAFKDPFLLSELEKLLHPRVQKEIETQYQEATQNNYPLFIAEIPLLYESGLNQHYDSIVVVVADEKRCKERFNTMSRYNKEEYDRRNQRLIPIENKMEQADYIIKNNGSYEDLYQFVTIIFNSLKGNL